jgi:hypothetical protein
MLAVFLALWFRGIRDTVYVNEIKLPGGLSFLSEDPASPELTAFRREEKLDAVTAGKSGDLDRLRALLLWARDSFKASSPLPDYPPWNGREILRMIRSGKTGGFCAQHALLFGQAAQSFGYFVRYTELTSADLQSDHFICEVYVPELAKWAAFDPGDGRAYADQDGRLLSALEIHDNAFGRKRRAVYRWPGMEPARGEEKLFAHFQYFLRNNFMTLPAYYQIREMFADPERDYNGKKGRVICQWNFEPYKLRYDDPRLPYRRESLSLLKLSSPDRKNFDFTFDPDSRSEAEVFSLEGFRKLLLEGEPYKIRRIKLPRKVMKAHQDDLMSGLPGFRPLAVPGDSLRRYNAIQKAYARERD